MHWLNQHEIFEIEVLTHLKSYGFLESFVFGGGTMLRLCHELPRYSVDLDFWKLKVMEDQMVLDRLTRAFSKTYEITDAQLKHFTILLEIRSVHFPRKLKIEIRRELKEWEYEDKIAFSNFSVKQVLLKGHTLRQMMTNKIQALLSRRAIRDAFDLEFLLRKGIPLPQLNKENIMQLIEQIESFGLNDFKVTLGSILENDLRQYYVENGFRYLKEKLIKELNNVD